jgi:hypothetical protein
MFEWLFGKKVTCLLCGTDKMGDRPGIVQYNVSDIEEMLESKICTGCSDDLSDDADTTMRELMKDPKSDV